MAYKEKPIYIKEFYTLEQLEQEINFNVRSLREQIKQGKLKASKVGNGYILQRENIIAWLNNAEVKTNK